MARDRDTRVKHSKAGNHAAFAHRKGNNAHRAQSKPVNPLKSKIRDLTRLLDHNEGLPADVRLEKERALAGYNYDLEIALHDQRKQKMISKYHMVRFFERQKATRNLKKLQRELSTESIGSVAGEDIQLKIYQAQIDLNYTIHFPLMQKYVGLFPRQKMEQGHNALSREEVSQSARDTNMWKVVEDCTREGTLDLLREEGKFTSRDQGGKHTIMNLEKPKKKTKESSKTRHKDHDEDSDGGFFET